MNTHRSRALLVCLSLALALTLMLSACGNRLVKIVAEDGDLFRNTKAGTTYQVLPASYEPIARGQEYGRLDIDGVKFTLHEMPGMDPADWLCSVYGDVYCNSGYTVPTFESWDISVLHVCTNTNLVVDALTVKPSTSQPQELCDELFVLLQTACTRAPTVDYPSWAEVSRAYTLRFESEDAPGIYYSVKLIEYAEDIMTDEENLGRTFLYDRYAGRCVTVPDTIFRMLDGASLDEALS